MVLSILTSTGPGSSGSRLLCWHVLMVFRKTAQHQGQREYLPTYHEILPEAGLPYSSHHISCFSHKGEREREYLPFSTYDGNLQKKAALARGAHCTRERENMSACVQVSYHFCCLHFLGFVRSLETRMAAETFLASSRCSCRPIPYCSEFVHSKHSCLYCSSSDVFSR